MVLAGPFTVDMFTCHGRKSTDVPNNITDHSDAIINFIIYTFSYCSYCVLQYSNVSRGKKNITVKIQHFLTYLKMWGGIICKTKSVSELCFLVGKVVALASTSYLNCSQQCGT